MKARDRRRRRKSKKAAAEKWLRQFQAKHGAGERPEVLRAKAFFADEARELR